MNLTAAQQSALDAIAKYGHLHSDSSNSKGIRLATLEVLKRHGLIELRSEWHRKDFSGESWKPLGAPILEWTATLK